MVLAQSLKMFIEIADALLMCLAGQFGNAFCKLQIQDWMHQHIRLSGARPKRTLRFCASSNRFSASVFLEEFPLGAGELLPLPEGDSLDFSSLNKSFFTFSRSSFFSESTLGLDFFFLYDDDITSEHSMRKGSSSLFHNSALSYSTLQLEGAARAYVVSRHP